MSVALGTVFNLVVQLHSAYNMDTLPCLPVCLYAVPLRTLYAFPAGLRAKVPPSPLTPRCTLQMPRFSHAALDWRLSPRQSNDSRNRYTRTRKTRHVAGFFHEN